MVWPVAALAVVLLGFVIVYGSNLQARMERAVTRVASELGGEPDSEL